MAEVPQSVLIELLNEGIITEEEMQEQLELYPDEYK